MCYFFQIQTLAPQGNLRDVMSPSHPVLSAVPQTSIWSSGVDIEANAPRLDLTVAPQIPVSAPVSVSAPISVLGPLQVETQAPEQASTLITALHQPPVPVSSPAIAMPQTCPATAPTSIPMQVQLAVPASASVPSEAVVSAPCSTFELPNILSTISDTPLTGKPQFPVPGLVSTSIPTTLPALSVGPTPAAASIPAPVQPAGIQTAVSGHECSSLATTQQNLKTQSSSLQQELSLEVGIKPHFAHFQ